jgi:hypothetical protein
MSFPLRRFLKIADRASTTTFRFLFPPQKYAVLFCFENEIRDFIREALEEHEGHDWLDKLPPKIKEHAESRRDAALKDSWLEGEKADLLGFVDFGHLAQIITAKWDFFKDVVPTQHWLKQRMDELEKSRNFIVHNRMLLPSEFQRPKTPKIPKKFRNESEEADWWASRAGRAYVDQKSADNQSHGI